MLTQLGMHVDQGFCNLAAQKFTRDERLLAACAIRPRTGSNWRTTEKEAASQGTTCSGGVPDRSGYSKGVCMMLAYEWHV